jgi:hypothetical protein
MSQRFKLTAPEPYEIEIQKVILVQLAYHPSVAWAERVNSGAAMLPSGRGKSLRPVKFNTIKGCSDILGQLKDGRFLAIEVKRPPWTAPKDDHEKDQADFLAKVNAANGVAFFATSIDQVAENLKSALHIKIP